MPANVTPEYAAAERKYQAASSLEDKLTALQGMKRLAPKHKGGENLRAEISRKIKKLRSQLEKQELQRKKTSGASLTVKKEGIGQVALVGAANSGKSTLLCHLANVHVDIAPYPFTTKRPEVGMMDYEGGKVQLVEIPPLVEDASKGKANGVEMLSIVRNADAILFVLDAALAKKEFALLRKELNAVHILANRKKPDVQIVRSEFKGIQISGKNHLRVSERAAVNFLKERDFYNCAVTIHEPCTLDTLAEALDTRLVYKPAIAVLVDKARQGALLSNIPPNWTAVCVSDFSEKEVQEMKEKIFSMLGVILVWTKKPREKKAQEPMALRKGATVQEAANTLHKDIGEHLKYAKVWGSTRYPGQRVAKDYVLKHRDVVEVYS